MRFSPFIFAIAGATIVFNGLFLSPSALGQSYGDVTVKKNPDGSIETYDNSASSDPAPRRQSRSTYKRSTQKYNDGVVVRKNADGSIETFDTSDVAAPRTQGRSSGVHKAVHKYSDGVTVKRNHDGTIESFDTAPAGRKAGYEPKYILNPKWRGNQHLSAKSRNSGKPGPSAKAGSLTKTHS